MFKYLYTALLVLCMFASCMPKNAAYQTAKIPNKAVILTKKQQLEKETILIEAKKFSLLSKLEDARKQYLKAIKIDPSCANCYYELAMLYYRAGFLSKAENFSEIANILDTSNMWYQRQYAQIAFNLQHYDIAEKYYKVILKELPNQHDSYFNLAAVYENRGDFPKAIQLYDSVQARFGFSDEVAHRKHQLLFQQGEFSKAITEAEELVKNNPNDPRYLVFLGDSYAQASRDQEAQQSYDKALVLEPDFPMALAGKAEALRKTGDFENFFVYLKQYIGNDKVDDKSKSEYLGLLLQLPSFASFYEDEFDSIFENLETTDADSEELAYVKAAYLAQTERIDLAFAVLEKTVAADSTDIDRWFRLISFDYGAQRWDKLVKDADKAIQLFPDKAMFYFYSGVALSQQNNVKEAISVLEKSQTLEGVEPLIQSQIHGFLGDLYYQDKNPKKSFEYYEKVLAVDSLNAMILNNYAYHLSLVGKDMNRAYTMSKKAVELEGNNASFLDTYAWILFKQGKLQEAKTIFRQALSSGGKDSGVVLDHYADVLYELGEHDTASVYWNMALEKDDCENPDDVKKKLEKLNKK